MPRGNVRHAGRALRVGIRVRRPPFLDCIIRFPLGDDPSLRSGLACERAATPMAILAAVHRLGRVLRDPLHRVARCRRSIETSGPHSQRRRRTDRHPHSSRPRPAALPRLSRRACRVGERRRGCCRAALDRAHRSRSAFGVARGDRRRAASGWIAAADSEAGDLIVPRAMCHVPRARSSVLYAARGRWHTAPATNAPSR